MASKNPEKYEAEFWRRLDTMSGVLSIVGRQLTDRLTQSFESDTCQLGFRGPIRDIENDVVSEGGIWRAMGKNVFVIVDPEKRNQRIRVDVHAFKKTLERVPCFEVLNSEEKSHSSAKRMKEGPPVQHIYLTRADEIACVIECVKAARERWGRGKREI